MDLQSQIEARRKILRATKTILTNEKGDKYEIFDGVERKIMEKCLPFVIDDKPDMEVARIIEGLYMGSQDPVTSEELLRLHRIRHVLSLGVRAAVKYEGINYHFVDFYDLPEFDISRVIEETFRVIHNCRSDNIFVHCNAGVSRSATIVIAYLMALEKLNYDEAYNRVKSKRNCVRPNEGFVRQLKASSNFHDILDNLFNSRIDES